MRLQTAMPKTDSRIPQHAPVLGAISVPYVDPGEVGGAPGINAPSAPLPSKDPIPEVLLGALTAGASGALTGGIAANTWSGAALGASFTMGAWSLLTLFNAWNTTGRTTRIVLGSIAAIATTATVSFVVKRRRGR